MRLNDYDIIVDCMLGTGFSGIPREPIASLIKEINKAGEEHGAFVISVDINSGMNGDTGEDVPPESSSGDRRKPRRIPADKDEKEDAHGV